MQRAPDGQDHGSRGEYREIDRPHRLVRTLVYRGAPEHESVETVTLQSEGGGTLVSGKSVFPSFAARDLYARAGMEFGMRESHQRLDEWLDAIKTNRSEMSMSKLVEATHVTLGGEIGSPDAWAHPYLDDQHARYASELPTAADALLLGRHL